MSDGSMGLNHFLWAAWDWDLSKIIGCAALIVVFACWTRLRPILTVTFFLLGVVLLFLSLASPLDALSDEYLFSAHMLQHFVLLMIVPPLLILGLPEERTRRLLMVPWIRNAEKRLNRPVYAWIIANLILWVWHLPELYDRTLRSEGIHIFEHLTFLVSATIFWWPILAPAREFRMSFPFSVIYLLSAALSNMILGIFLTFAPEPLYVPYLSPDDSWKILGVLRSRFHLGPLADQNLGGLLMWVLGSVVFLGAILLLFARWYEGALERDSPEMEKI